MADDTRPERFATQPGEVKIVAPPPERPLPALPVLPAPAAATGGDSRARREQIDDAVLAAGGARRAITPRNGQPGTVFVQVATPEGIDDVVLTEEFLSGVASDGAGTAQLITRVLPALTDPAEVWLGWGEDEYRRMFLAAFDDGGAVVVEERPLGALAWGLMSLDQVSSWRQGDLLYRRGIR